MLGDKISFCYTDFVKRKYLYKKRKYYLLHILYLIQKNKFKIINKIINKKMKGDNQNVQKDG